MWSKSSWNLVWLTRISAIAACATGGALALSCDWAPFDGPDPRGDADSDADADGDADGDAGADADADTDADGDTDTDTDADADGDTDTDTDADADGDTDIDTDADLDTGCDPEACAGSSPPAGRCVGPILIQPSSPGECVDDRCEHPEVDVDCSAIGCCVDRCCTFTPSNAADFGTFDEEATDVVVPAGSSFDTANDCFGETILGSCEAVAPDTSPHACVCRTGSLTIEGLAVTGSWALVLLASREVTITGDLRVAPGAGSSSVSAGGQAGGSYGTIGGNSGPEPWGTEELVPLVGGMPSGGPGAGALQISSLEGIRVEGTVSTPGGGGPGCPFPSGGGSGGAVLLEAASVELTGTVAANGGGGGGGYAQCDDCDRCGSPGRDGNASAVAASGGVGTTETGGGNWCKGREAGHGGTGGVGSVLDGNGGSGGPGDDGSYNQDDDDDCESMIAGQPGAGGGGAGRIRINTIEPCACFGLLTPSATVGLIGVE